MTEKSKKEKKSITAKKAENNSVEKSTETGENKPRKPLSKKQKILIIVTVILTVAIVATVIAVPLSLIKWSDDVNPRFERFDQRSDYYVIAVWDAVRNADSYTVEYFFDKNSPENTLTSVVTATKFSLQRKKGVLGLRVKANKNGAQFSDWIYLDIQSIVLSAPTVTISPQGIVSWTNVNFDYLGTRMPVNRYLVEIYINGGKKYYFEDWTGTTFTILNGYIKSYIGQNVYIEGVNEWTDILVEVRVKATTKPLSPLGVTSREEEYLLSVYTNVGSSYGYAEFTVTKEYYDNL